MLLIKDSKKSEIGCSGINMINLHDAQYIKSRVIFFQAKTSEQPTYLHNLKSNTGVSTVRRDSCGRQRRTPVAFIRPPALM